MTMSLGSGASFTYVEKCRGRASPVGETTRDSARYTRTILVDWDTAGIVERQVLGYSRHLEAGRIHRWLPEVYPNNSLMYAQSFGIEPLGDEPTTEIASATGKRISTYGTAIVTIQYGKLRYYVKAWGDCAGAEKNRFVEEKYKPAAKSLMLPRGMMKFAENPVGVTGVKGTEFQEGANRLERSAKIEWTWIGVPKTAVPWSVIDTSIGKVNNAPFTSLRVSGHSWTIGTLLLEDVDTTKYYYDPYGTEVYDITYFASYDPLGHNKVPHKVQTSSGQELVYLLVTTDGENRGSATDGIHLHDYFDWDTLFVPPAP